MKKNGFMLAAALMLVPICLLMTFSLVKLITTGAGFGLQQQQRVKAFYLAEAGLNTAFHIFGLGNYLEVTHDPSGSDLAEEDGGLHLPAGLNLSRDSEGWVEWTFDPGSQPVEDSFTRSGQYEHYRFRISYPDPAKPGEWRIDCEATVGNRRAFHQLAGQLVRPEANLIYDNGDLADLARTSNQRLEGSIHANGDLYLAPWETAGFPYNPSDPNHFVVAPSVRGANKLTALSLSNSDVTVGESLIRRRDFWGRVDPNGLKVELNGVSLGSSPSNFFDSESPSWDDPVNGALSVFNGRVRTRDVGAKQKFAPHSGLFEPGGYYSRKASLKIDENTPGNGNWLNKKILFNEAEKQRVEVAEIDLARLKASGQWPSNNLIYLSTPVRITNGAYLTDEITIVSSETVYLQGDFNKKYHSAGDSASDNQKQQPAAIMTADRVYRITDDFKDRNNSEYVFPQGDPDLFVHGVNEDPATATKMRPATDPSKFPGDPENVIEHNVVIVDSVPTEDTLAFVLDNDAVFPYNPQLKVRTTLDPVSGQPEFVFPSSEDFLENVSGIRFEHGGSEIHLRNAQMQPIPNKDNFTAADWGLMNYQLQGQTRRGSGPTPYVLRSYYVAPTEYWHTGPESEKPGIYRYPDEKVTGVLSNGLVLGEIPFALNAAQKNYWVSQ